MSRGFLSTLFGLGLTIFSWFSPWSWPAWPALTLLSIAHRPATYTGRAAFVVFLIVVNTAFWSAIVYILSRWLRRTSALGLLLLALPLHALTAKAIFAGGCFWCTESDFEKVPGVIAAVSGYIGGREAVEVTFDAAKVDYAKLLDVYWHSIDPLDDHGQFCDGGPQYRSAIFYLNDVQKRQAEASKAAVVKRLGKAYTDVLPALTFSPASDEDQDYYKKNPVRYRFYRFNCGRDDRLRAVWGR